MHILDIQFRDPAAPEKRYGARIPVTDRSSFEDADVFGRLIHEAAMTIRREQGLPDFTLLVVYKQQWINADTGEVEL